jgi:DNA polymerase-3 subunit delta'
MQTEAETAQFGAAPYLRGLDGIVGQDAVVAVLRSAIAAGRPHHAYLFDGPEGVGKATTARALMAALNCQAPPRAGDACGRCESCSKVGSGSHPDLIIVTMELAGLADEIERLLKRLTFRPVEGRAQVILIDPADQLTAPTALVAANRLLKTLEEPRPDTHFVLVSTCASGLLQTIRSRCQRLRFVPLADEVIAQTLMTQFSLEEAMAKSMTALSQGSLGRAVRCAQDPETLQRRQREAEELLTAARGGRAGDICQRASEIGADRDEAVEVLELLWLRLHGDLRRHGLAGALPLAQKTAEALRVVRETQTAIRRYTSAPLSIERLGRHLHSALARSVQTDAGQGRSAR